MSKKVNVEVFADLKVLFEAEDMSNSSFLYELFNGDYDELGYDYGLTDYNDRRQKQNSLLEKAKQSFGYEHVTGEGGSEGGGEYCYGVITFQDKYYKAEWSYYSYNGCDYDYIEDTIREVTPREKTITIYE